MNDINFENPTIEDLQLLYMLGITVKIEDGQITEYTIE